MKKKLLSVFALATSMLALNEASAQNRYLDEVFTSVSKSSNVVYDTNYAINLLYGNTNPAIPAPFTTTPVWAEKLKCDIYTPVGDTLNNRPVIILTHTGSYLPPLVNKQTTGSKDDSSLVELANRFAKRGYVVVAMNYRLGWNPAATSQEVATEQLIKATYRALQDMRNCVRFMRRNAATYGIDETKIIFGGQGTGGYIGLAGATVNTRADIESNIKFLRGDASPMVSVDTLGDWTGLGGAYPYNDPADASISSDVNMFFNFGGAMGDTAWMKANSKPMVAMHTTRDPFAPYRTGNVIVPTTGLTVIPNASGAGDVIPKANGLGVNNKLNSYVYLDPMSDRANTVSKGINNLFGFETSFPFEGSPWEWWDRPSMKAAQYTVYRDAIPLPASGYIADSLSMLTNPFMSAERGKAYIDTIVGYVAPRIAVQMDLMGSMEINDFALSSPINGASIDIHDDTAAFMVAKWQGAQGLDYVFMIDNVNGDFSDPLYSTSISADSIAFTENMIWTLLTTMGYNVDQEVSLKWTVMSKNAAFGKMAAQAFVINLTKRAAVGINEASYNKYITLYPNPATSSVKVGLDANAKITDIQIIDILGRQVKSYVGFNTNSQEISLAGIGSGAYFINITTQNGGTASKKFIIQ
jgi:hypothetical protein